MTSQNRSLVSDETIGVQRPKTRHSDLSLDEIRGAIGVGWVVYAVLIEGLLEIATKLKVLDHSHELTDGPVKRDSAGASALLSF
jgi:hypothetical protein